MIPRWVEPYLRIPFVSRGRDERGCDCFGLVRLVLLKELGLEVKEYGFIKASDKLTISLAISEAEADHTTWKPVRSSDARTFDVIPMIGVVDCQDGRKTVQETHVGIFVAPGVVLHTEFDSGPACVPVRHPDVAVRLTPQAWRHRSLWA